MRWNQIRSKWILSAALASALFFTLVPAASAQVAPAARIDGLPIYAGVGFSRYYLDYGPGRYMEGVNAWVGADLFHGFGIDGSARTIFMNTPPSLTRMQQTTYLGGIHYNFRRIGITRPYVRMGGGIGDIEFPSSSPTYTRDSYSVFAPSGGVDVRVVNHVYIRGEYEYQFWQDYQGPNYLNPQGWTIGAIYSFRSISPRSHYQNMN